MSAQLNMVSSGGTELTTTPEASAPLRVLHLNPGNLYGGVETLLTTLARFRHLNPALEPHFACCFEARSTAELREAGVPVHLLGRVRISRPWTVWRARRRLRELLDNQHFDLVICHMYWPLVVFGPTVRAARLKLHVWAHGFQAKGNFLQRLARRTPPDLVIANSRYTADAVRQDFPGSPMEVFHYPVALTEQPEAENWRRELRDEYGIGPDTTLIVQVSRMESWKGHALHLEALSRLETPGKWACWMVGGAQTPDEEQYLAQLHEMAKRLGIAGQVRFLGHRADIPRLLAAADIFCQPNLGPEPFGIVFIEALWAKRPVVSTALGGAREIVNDSCGALVAPGDAGALSAVLQTFIENPEVRRRLGAHGPSRAAELCDPAKQLKHLERLCRSAKSSSAKI